MDNNIELKTIWQQQKISQPNLNELLAKLKQFKESRIRELIFSNVILVFTCLIIIMMWSYYQPQFITTKVGLALTIASMAIFVFSHNNLFFVYNKIDNTQSNNEYLYSLMILKHKQKYLHIKMLGFYFIALSTGICLYIYEYTLKMNSVWTIFTYIITMAWIAFNWFYLRPKTIKKQQAKLDQLISKFEIITKQLEATE